MKKIKLIWRILQKMDLDKIIGTYLLTIMISSFLLVRVEPQIDNILEGIWFCFVTFTTIGFGDIVVTTIIGRIITIIMALYGIIVVALFTGVIVNYYQELNKIKLEQSIEIFFDKLERLPELSKEELKQISDNIKKKRNKI